jgi:hypothetical protein
MAPPRGELARRGLLFHPLNAGHTRERSNAMRKFVIAAGLIASATTAAWSGQMLGPDEKYDPQVNPADFTTAITNPYFSLPVGRKLVYEQRTALARKAASSAMEEMK